MMQKAVESIARQSQAFGNRRGFLVSGAIVGHIHLIDIFIQTLGGLHKYLLILNPYDAFLVDILPADDHPHGLVEGQNKDARYDAQPVIILPSSEIMNS